MGIVGLIAGLVVGGVGMAKSAKAMKKVSKAQERATDFERQKAMLQSTRQRLDAIRTARAAYATVQQAAENQGVASSSAAQGGQASIVSQMGANLSFLDQYGFMSDQASRYLGKAQKAQNSANMWGAISNFGFQVANFSASTLKSAGGGG